jgi:hypothetical protein
MGMAGDRRGAGDETPAPDTQAKSPRQVGAQKLYMKALSMERAQSKVVAKNRPTT